MNDDDVEQSATMLKARKKIRNAFFFFMQDLKAQWIRNGKLAPNTSMAEMPAIASPVWQNLDPDDKEYYQECAKNYKAQRKGLPPEKYYTVVKRRDCLGVPLERHVNAEKLSIQRRKQHRSEDKARFKRGTEVTKQTFCFINFQLMFDVFESSPEKDNQAIIPLEVGVAIYSISKGITRTYQKFIKPKEIPTGYRYDAIRHSEQSHRIPVPDFDLAYDNYEQIWEEIISIVNWERLPKLPPVYTQSTKCHIAEGCLAWLAEKAYAENVFEGNVHEAEGLFVDLLTHGIECMDRDQGTFSCLTMAMAEDLLTTTAYDYEVSKRCLFHQGHYDHKDADGTILEENDHCSKFCSLGTVQRYCFVFSEKLCDIFDIEVTENHLPEMSDTDSCIARVYVPSLLPESRSFASFSAKEAEKRSTKGRQHRRGKGRGIPSIVNVHPPAQHRKKDTDEDLLLHMPESMPVQQRKQDRSTSSTMGKDLPSTKVSPSNSYQETAGAGRGRGRGRGMTADMSQPRQPKIPPATTVANSTFQTPLRSIAERSTGWIPGMAADMSQPRQPKIPPATTVANSTFQTPLRSIAERSTGWIPGMTADMSQPRQPKIPPATTVANSPFQTPLTSIAERPTSWIPGMTADMSQPRQPKIPPATTVTNSPFQTPLTSIAECPTGWIPRPPGTGFQINQQDFPPVGATSKPTFQTVPPGFSAIPQQLPPMRLQGLQTYQQQPGFFVPRQPPAIGNHAGMFQNQATSLALGRGRGLFNVTTGKQQYAENYSLSSYMGGLYLDGSQ